VLVIALIGALAATGAVAGAVVGRHSSSKQRGLPEASGRSGAERATSFLAKLIPPEPEQDSASGPQVPRGISDLAKRLPLERKVAQLFLFGFRGTDLTAPIFSQLRRLDLGGIVLDRSNYTGPQVLTQIGGEAIVISQQAKHVPPWVMAQQEGGEFSAFPDLPPSGAPADLGTVAAAGQQAAQSAAALRPLGVTGVLGPVVDVGPEQDPSLGARIFSDDPRKVAAYAQATVSAYNRARVFSAVKHFPGLGGASQPTEAGPATVGQSLDELRGSDLVPFRAAIAAGVPGIVLSHALYSVDDFTTPGSLSHRVATDLLRGELHFRGVAISDDLGDPAITTLGSVPDAAVKALAAGADMLYISGPAGDQQAAYVAVLRAVQSKQIPRARLDEAVLRILQAKRRLGVIER
jgi:beta-N-acetylhexosaminidase